MPEGDTIHKLAAVLGPAVEGRVLADARLESMPVESFRGRRVDQVFAHGKHLFIVVGALALRTHLGMSGSWHRYAPGERWQRPRWQASALIATDADVFVCFRAKEAELVDRRGVRYRELMAGLGPDLLADEFDVDAVVSRARSLLGEDALLCEVLLDQRVGAGIGNVYKSEVLFLSGLHPLRRLGATPDDRLAESFLTARALMQRNLGPGMRQTRAPRPRGAARPAAGEERSVWVYRRGGEPCGVCDAVIRYRRAGRGNRSCYWCERCQPLEDPR